MAGPTETEASARPRSGEARVAEQARAGRGAARAHHVVVWIAKDGAVLGYRVMDLRTEYRPLAKELGLRAAAGCPPLAGCLWEPGAQVVGSDAARSKLRIEAFLAESGPSPDLPLASVDVPIEHFGWVAAGVARQCGVDGAYAYYVGVLAPEDPVVRSWGERATQDDFEILSDEEPELRLPTAFVPTPPPGSRRILDARPSWLRCVFSRRVGDVFLGAAWAETDRERHWAGAGTTYLAPEACWVVIEDMVELPAAEAGWHYVVTHGSGSRPIRERLGDRLNAHLHLHPRAMEGKPLPPSPSGPDATVAWNFDQGSPSPCCFPIALFGTDPRAPAGDVAAHGYERGILSPVQLEEFDDAERDPHCGATPPSRIHSA
jgi:hypothetical protein